MTLRLLAKRRVSLREAFGGTRLEVDIEVSVNLERDSYVVIAKAVSENVDVISMDHLPLRGE